MNEPDPRELRVSDAERQHVAGLLEKAVGRGLLTLDEFGERSETAFAARNRGELNAVLADLPGLTHEEHSPASAAPAEIRATMSTVTRTGRWPVPEELRLRNRAGTISLDFTEARVEHAEVRIELDVVMGSIELLLPAGAELSTTGVACEAGSLEDKTSGQTRPGVPRFVLRGTVRAGSVGLRTPKYYQVGRLQVRLPWRVTLDRD
ncbi:hypothetical protein CFN78_13885 [Amycolatopsis antarctica]|uniref:DUF1707 domain-containing protein n=1 Tax=Amycolatopsis antarctica TaxID=1854586 RepID=A0A263D2L5_9PSEU|nr:DUF1707 domain-containing protein [Amycolatopsis antarctica]OZM72712.1 hypothetical protein CFN78_13885 [Amycolatopsis antarctica]